MAPTTAPRRNSIVDDWEEVGGDDLDDSLSVVSLPGSDDEGPAPRLADLTPERAISRGDPAGKTSALPHNKGTSPPHNGRGKETATELPSGWPSCGDDADGASRSDAPDPEPPYEPPVSECLCFDPKNDANDSDDDDDDSDESEDLDLDVLLQELVSVRAILRDTVHSIDNLTMLHHETSQKARKLCQALALHAEELQPIVAGYARVWKHSSIGIPLDPGLHAWLSGVRVKAIALQVELQDEVQRTRQRARSVSTNSALHLIWEYLESCEQQMDDFLPIMQVDFNEFQTQHMRIPTAPVPAGYSGAVSQTRPLPVLPPEPTPHMCGRHTYLPSTPTDHVGLVRTELYRLRDGVVKAIATLTRISQYFTPPHGDRASEIADRFRGVLSSLSTLVSNHGSDWIEQGLSDGLTYAEFSRLEVGEIRGLAMKLDDDLKYLDTLRRVMGKACYLQERPGRDFRYDPTDTTVSTFHQLEDIVQALIDLLRIQIA